MDKIYLQRVLERGTKDAEFELRKAEDEDVIKSIELYLDLLEKIKKYIE